MPAAHIARDRAVGHDRLGRGTGPQPGRATGVTEGQGRQVDEHAPVDRSLEPVVGRRHHRAGRLDRRYAPSEAPGGLGLDRDFLVAPVGPSRRRDLQIGEGDGCGDDRQPVGPLTAELDFAPRRASQCDAAEVEDLLNLGREPLHVERPLRGRPLGRARGRQFDRCRCDARLLHPQPTPLGGAATPAEPGRKRLVPPQRPLLHFPGHGLPVGRDQDALHRGQIAGRDPQLEHAIAAVGTCRGGQLQPAIGHADVRPHGEATRHRPRGGRQVDVGGDREVFGDEVLGPLPGAGAGQPDPSRRLGLEQGRLGDELPHHDPPAGDRQIEWHLAPLHLDQLRERVGAAEGELIHGERAHGLAAVRGEREVEADVSQPVHDMASIEPGGEHARHAQGQSVRRDRHGPRPARIAGGRRHTPATVPGEHRGRVGGDRRPVEPPDGGRRDRRGRAVRLRGGRVGRARMPHAARHGPAGERGIGPHRAGHDHIRHPPGVAPLTIHQFHDGIDDLEIEGWQRRLGWGGEAGEPGGEHVLERAAAPPHLEKQLGVREPHHPQVPWIPGECHEAPVDHRLRHDHERPARAVAEHDIAVFDPAEPVPPGRAAHHAAVDPGEHALQRPIAQAREDRDRRRHPADRRQHRQACEREDGPSRPSPAIVSGISPGHDGGV